MRRRLACLLGAPLRAGKHRCHALALHLAKAGPCLGVVLEHLAHLAKEVEQLEVEGQWRRPRGWLVVVKIRARREAAGTRGTTPPAPRAAASGSADAGTARRRRVGTAAARSGHRLRRPRRHRLRRPRRRQAPLARKDRCCKTPGVAVVLARTLRSAGRRRRWRLAPRCAPPAPAADGSQQTGRRAPKLAPGSRRRHAGRAPARRRR